MFLYYQKAFEISMRGRSVSLNTFTLFSSENQKHLLGLAWCVQGVGVGEGEVSATWVMVAFMFAHSYTG